MQVGTTKDQGLYNKPSAAVHPGALATWTLPQYNTIFVLVYRVKGTLNTPTLFPPHCSLPSQYEP